MKMILHLKGRGSGGQFIVTSKTGNRVVIDRKLDDEVDIKVYQDATGDLVVQNN